MSKTIETPPRRVTADICIDSKDGTVAIRWDGGLSKDDALRTIQVYLNIAMRFAHDLGGCDNAFEAMKAIVQETRKTLAQTQGTPIIGTPERTFKIADA